MRLPSLLFSLLLLPACATVHPAYTDEVCKDTCYRADVWCIDAGTPPLVCNVQISDCMHACQE